MLALILTAVISGLLSGLVVAYFCATPRTIEAAREKLHALRLPAIRVAFLAFCLSLISWSLPPLNFRPQSVLNEISAPLINISGFWQRWDMFSPPLKLNARMRADIELMDGTQARFYFPEPEAKLGLARYTADRFRKLTVEGLRLDSNAALWPDTARWVAKEYQNRSGKIPRVVHLVREWDELASPQTHFLSLAEMKGQAQKAKNPLPSERTSYANVYTFYTLSLN